MKKIFFIAAAALFTATIAKADPSEKLLNSFKSTFPAAKNVKWNDSESGYMVSFVQTGTLTKIKYDKEGNFVNSLRYYQEKDLPVKILMTLRKKYNGKNVFGVTEFTNAEGIIYQVTLNDDKKWYIVNASTDGDLTLKDSYLKSE